MIPNRILRLVALLLIFLTVLLFLVWNAGLVALPLLPSPIPQTDEQSTLLTGTESASPGESTQPSLTDPAQTTAAPSSSQPDTTLPDTTAPDSSGALTTPAPTFPDAAELLEKGAQAVTGEYDPQTMVLARMELQAELGSLTPFHGSRIYQIKQRVETQNAGLSIVEKSVTRAVLSLEPYMGYIIAHTDGGAYLLDNEGNVLNSEFPDCRYVYDRDGRGRPIVLRKNRYYAITAAGNLTQIEYTPDAYRIAMDAPAAPVLQDYEIFSEIVAVFWEVDEREMKEYPDDTIFYTEEQKEAILGGMTPEDALIQFPAQTEPEETEPSETDPDTTDPESTNPDATDPEQTEPSPSTDSETEGTVGQDEIPASLTESESPDQTPEIEPAPEEPLDPEDETTSGEDTTAPEDETTPSEDTTAPEDETTPGEDTTAPEDETTPGEDTTSPEDETTPGEDTTAPEDETTPGEDTTAPEDETTPGEDTTAPEDDEPAVPLIRYVLTYEPRSGYRDASGNVIAEPRYIKAFPFGENGLAAAIKYSEVVESAVLVFLNTSGREVIDVSGKIYWNYTVNNNPVVDGYYPSLNTDESAAGSYFFDQGYVMVRRRLAIWDRLTIYSEEEILIDETGAVFPLPDGYTLRGYSSGILLLEKNGKYGYMNIRGQWIAQPIYNEAQPFYQGLAVVKRNGCYGMIDTSGKLVLPIQYLALSHASNGVITGYYENEWMLLRILDPADA